MTLSIDTLELEHGSHKTRDDGLCIMEAVAWLAEEQHSDQPKCASPVIRNFAMGLNDAWNDEQRQKLIPYAKLIVNTANGLDDQRALMAFDWLVRAYLPAWLHLAGLTERADQLANEPVFSDWSMLGELTTAQLSPARKEADAAGAAAGDAAWDVAEAAAQAAAWDVAEDAARAAAGAAAEDAAWDVAGAVLQPTVTQLQNSALDLLDRMCRL